MAQQFVRLVDKDNENRVFPPRLADGEERIEGSPNDILRMTSDDKPSYFSLEFRMKDAVIESIARQYHPFEDYESYAAYFADEANEEQLYLLGKAARLVQRDAIGHNCLGKVSEALDRESRISDSDIVALHLIEADHSDENRQKFLLLTKGNIYLRNETLAVEEYDYGEIRFLRDGLEHVGSGRVKRILEHEFDQRFWEFVQEFALLKRDTLYGVGVRHPMSDLTLETRQKYLKFLTEAASADGRLSVAMLLRLEYLAREFRISDGDLTEWLQKTLNENLKPTELKNRFTSLKEWLKKAEAKDRLTEQLNKELTGLLTRNEPQKIPVQQWHVVFQDILELIAELATGQMEAPHSKKLLDILRRDKDSTAGADFVNGYCDFVRLRNQAMRHLGHAVGSIPYRDLSSRGYLDNICNLQRYHNEQSLKIMEIGVLANVK